MQMIGTQELALYSLTMGSVSCASLVAFPAASLLWARMTGRLAQSNQVRIDRAAKQLDDMFMDIRPARLKAAYVAVPVATGLALYLFSSNVVLALIAGGAGVLLPDFWLKQTIALRRRKFESQLVDALFILSSSLRAGLSITQAFEQLESEMPAPASQEFGLMMKAHRLGRTLEDALQDLNSRMPCEALTLITTAVLVARETGGDVTGIINQLITSIREKKKLHDKVNTLTLQGRLQAYIMSALPLLFGVFIRSVNPEYFNLLMEVREGQMALAVACTLWLVGIVLLMKMSKVDV